MVELITLKDLTKVRGRKTHVFFSRMCPELPGEDVEDLLAHPATLGERREGEVVGVDLSETCNKPTWWIAQLL